MSRGEKRVFFFVMAVLAVALTIMVGQTLTGADTPRIYRVSVLTDGSDEDYWRSFRKGLEQAALEYNVDLRYVTRYDSPQGQAEALRREWEGEADGVVVVPVDASALAQALAEAPQFLAVTFAGAWVDSTHAAARVAADNRAMGARLADAVAERGAATCVIYGQSDSSTAVEERYLGFTGRLEELGIAYQREESGPDGPLAAPHGALVALEPALAEALCQQPGTEGRVYGVGTSNRLLRYLEDGQAAALVVQSDYTAGYLSLQRTAERLSGRVGEDVTLDCYTVTRENMFTDPLAQLLFPVT